MVQQGIFEMLCTCVGISTILIYIYKFNLPLIAGFPRVACDVEIDNGGEESFRNGHRVYASAGHPCLGARRAKEETILDSQI